MDRALRLLELLQDPALSSAEREAQVRAVLAAGRHPAKLYLAALGFHPRWAPLPPDPRKVLPAALVASNQGNDILDSGLAQG